MPDLVKRLDGFLRPDPSRTVMRPFEIGDPEGFVDKSKSRAERVTERIMTLDAAAVQAELRNITRSLDGRHRDVEPMLKRRFEEVEGLTIDRAAASPEQALLIGAYFTEEFSFESAALFNPSAVLHPDQSGLHEGDWRLLIALRGIGEGHVSSLTFRSAVWAADGSLKVDDPPASAVGPRIEQVKLPNGELLYRLHCGGADCIEELVVFPFLPSQGRGIEDVRLVQFREDDGEVDYRATFTAFSGSDVREVLMHTADFRTLELRGVEGPWARAKGMALFPRRIGGRYFALGRQDNENVWLMSSDDPHVWEGGEKVITPKFPWEFIQMGNCGSPMELDEGWLVLTHGVGAVRNYCIGACLLDKDDPSRLIARLEGPLLEPDDSHRDGYVPNVVYSCGALVRDRTLLLPYGVADNFAAFGTVDIDALLAEMR